MVSLALLPRWILVCLAAAMIGGASTWFLLVNNDYLSLNSARFTFGLSWSGAHRAADRSVIPYHSWAALAKWRQVIVNNTNRDWFEVGEGGASATEEVAGRGRSTEDTAQNASTTDGSGENLTTSGIFESPLLDDSTTNTNTGNAARLLHSSVPKDKELYKRFRNPLNLHTLDYLPHSARTPESTCIYPIIDSFAGNLMAETTHKQMVNCTRSDLELTYIDPKNRFIRVNEAKVTAAIGSKARLLCQYKVFSWISSATGMSDWIFFNTSAKLHRNAEFLFCACREEGNNVLSRKYYTLLPKKQPRKTARLLKKDVNAETSKGTGFSGSQLPSDRLNVIVFILHAVSRQQFSRTMNRTYAYLKQEMRSFEMAKHAQLSRETLENLLPLFEGENIVKSNQSFSSSDNATFLLRTFENAGYRTLLTGDPPKVDTLREYLGSFLAPPATYCTLPLSLVVESGFGEERDTFCLGHQPKWQFYMDYVRKFLHLYHSQPHFVLFFLSHLSDTDVSYLQLTDADFYSFLLELQSRHYLNRTVLVILSDHGPNTGRFRMTLQGMIESVSPLALLAFPNWFLIKYPEVAEHLQTNTERLTTHFDISFTLLDILDLAYAHQPNKDYDTIDTSALKQNRSQHNDISEHEHSTVKFASDSSSSDIHQQTADTKDNSLINNGNATFFQDPVTRKAHDNVLYLYQLLTPQRRTDNFSPGGAQNATNIVRPKINQTFVQESEKSYAGNATDQENDSSIDKSILISSRARTGNSSDTTLADPVVGGGNGSADKDMMSLETTHWESVLPSRTSPMTSSLLYTVPKFGDSPPRGLSMLGRIPNDRDCYDVSVYAELCLCGRVTYRELNPNSWFSRRLYTLVLNAINTRTPSDVCVRLSPGHFRRVVKVTGSNSKLTRLEGYYETPFIVQLATTPGGGVYEATAVVVSQRSWVYIKVSQAVQRLDRHVDQDDCPVEKKLKPFCLCKG